jgi:hypothetical protein
MILGDKPLISDLVLSQLVSYHLNFIAELVGPDFDSARSHIFTMLIPLSLVRSEYVGAQFTMHMARVVVAHTQY